ncbi:MAG: hypothetical protein AABM33_03485 [Pseudomonadota bacterium]
MTELTVKLPDELARQIRAEIDAARAERRENHVPSSMAGRGC